jgi:GT2 family glycosyltransferase
VIPGAVTVGFLHPGYYQACFAESLKELLFFDATGAQRIVSHDFGQLGKNCGSGGIVDGRNQLARVMCDESQAEWLFMVDSDMGFAPDTVERLIAAADPILRPVVGGLAFAQKTDGKASFGGIRYRCQPTIYRWYDQDDKVGVVPQFDYPRDQLVECAATGGACLLIHRTVFEKIRTRYGDNWFTPVTHPKGTTFSEDLSFCIRVAGADLPLFVHTGVRTTHDKGSVFLDEEYFDRQQAALALQEA